jgi:hypothetical protein
MRPKRSHFGHVYLFFGERKIYLEELFDTRNNRVSFR